MVTSLVSAFAAFASSNVDDVVLLMILGAEVGNSKVKRRPIWLGQMLAIGLMTALAVVGALCASFLPAGFQKYIGILGILPIALGVREFIDARRGNHAKRRAKAKQKMAKAPPADTAQSKGKIGVWQAFSMLFAGGVDNIGIYIPLFAAMPKNTMAVCAVLFMGLAAVWCWFSLALAGNAEIEAAVQKYEGIIVPVVFIAIGIFIFFDTGLL